MKKLNVEKKLSKKQIENLLSDESISKSSKIKSLFDSGLEIKEISTLLNIRYNFAYNVISNYVNVNSIEIEQTKKENKKEKIIELYLQNKSNKEISIELKTNYNYVFNTIKEYKSKNNIVNQ